MSHLGMDVGTGGSRIHLPNTFHQLACKISLLSLRPYRFLLWGQSLGKGYMSSKSKKNVKDLDCFPV